MMQHIPKELFILKVLQNKIISSLIISFFLNIGSDGLYWEILNDLSISASGCEPSKFALELCSSHSRVVIKAPNAMYLRAEQNGSIQATCQNSRQATQWEL